MRICQFSRKRDYIYERGVGVGEGNCVSSIIPDFWTKKKWAVPQKVLNTGKTQSLFSLKAQISLQIFVSSGLNSKKGSEIV